MQTDTGCAKLCLTDWKIQATLPVSLRYATGYFMISYGLLWLTLQTLTAGEGVQSSANVTLTNRVREKYPNLYETHFTHSVHRGVQTVVTLSEIGSYRMQSNIILSVPQHQAGHCYWLCVVFAYPFYELWWLLSVSYHINSLGIHINSVYLRCLCMPDTL